MPPSPWLVTLGTTTRNAAGEDWNYIFWQAVDGSSMSNRVIAVYRKDGEPAAAGNFTRQSVVRRQPNPVVITPLLDRSVNVGQDLALLSEQIQGLFQSVIPAPGLSLAEKLSAVVQGLAQDPALAPRAQMGARSHPGFAMALGQAWAERMPAGINVATYEMRDFDLISNSDRSVLARVTLRRGQPLILPAPGFPIEVPTNGPAKSLLARLRWSTPDDLRRLSPAVNGFNLYRIAQARATQLGYRTTPPAAGSLAAMSLTDPTIQRVNRQPIFLGKEFGSGDVGNFSQDGSTVFVSDSNHAGQGGPGFHDGDQFCYFVAARDILGRDGAYSAAGCVTLCDQVPPPPPHQLKVVNDFVITSGNGNQRLRIKFEPSAGALTNGTQEYRVYRWTNRLDLQRHDAVPTLVATVPHRAGTNRFTALDAGPTSPSIERHSGHVFWYTVRSAQRTACGMIESADSAPAPGILRDRSGPDSPPAELTLRQPEVEVQARPISNEGGGLTNLPPGGSRYWLQFRRASRDIAWIDVEMVDPALPQGTVTPGRHYFPQHQNNTSLPHATVGGFNQFQWGYVTTNKTGVKVRYSAGLANGIASPQQEFTLPPASAVNSVGVAVDFSVKWVARVATPGAGHYPRALVPESAERVTGVALRVGATSDMQQWRVYRRLDNGGLTMLAEGGVPQGAVAAGRTALPAAAGDITYTDDSMPINVAQATYYTQYLDRDGNAGKLVAAPSIFISSPPPAPTSLSLTAGGGTNDPASTMSLVWSAAPYGLSRYRIYVGNPARQTASLISVAEGVTVTPTATGRGGAAPASVSRYTGSASLNRFAIYRDFETESGTTNLPCTVIETSIIGGRMGEGPVYTNVLDRPAIDSDLYVLIESVAGDGTVGESSRTQKLPAGAGTRLKLPQAAWPARPLPPVASTNWDTEGQLVGGGNLGLSAVRLRRGNPEGATSADFDGIGVRIAFFLNPKPKSGKSIAEGRNAYLNGELDPDSLLVQDATSALPIFGQDNYFEQNVISTIPHFEVSSGYHIRPLRGVVMYRQQIPSSRYPQPAGDVIQVTPLMKGIAYRTYSAGAVVPSSFPMDLPATQIIDPFVGLFKGKGSTWYGLYLLDTQPLIQDATYQYFLVRFDEFGEMMATIPTNPVTATLEE